MVETLAELPFIGDQRVVAPELFEPFFADARAGCSGVFVTLPIAGPVPDRIEVPGDDVRGRRQHDAATPLKPLAVSGSRFDRCRCRDVLPIRVGVLEMRRACTSSGSIQHREIGPLSGIHSGLRDHLNERKVR